MYKSEEYSEEIVKQVSINGSKIEATWLAVVEFIKWYSKEQNAAVSDTTEAK